jgi:ABC-2 type transport system permease protein
MIEYATGADALLEIRSRGQLQRPFTRVADLFRNAQQKLQEQEATLSSKVTALEQQLGAINQQTQDLEFADLPESIKLKLQEFQDELLSARRDLRAVRHEIRSEVEALGRRLTLINLAAGPAQILFLALIVMMWRTYRSRARVRP